MSYYCEIYFKEIEAEDVYEFLKQFKKRAIERIPEIAKDVTFISPLANEVIFKNGDILSEDLRKRTMTWGRDSVFSYRCFYNKELHLLGVYGAGTQFVDLFDDVIAFQNSTDQDYEFETWEKIKPFKSIAHKWENMSDKDVKAVYMKNNHDDYEFDAEYYRKSYAYAEIWDLLYSTFNNDNEAIYFKLFSDHDIDHMIKFYGHIKQTIESDR